MPRNMLSALIGAPIEDWQYPDYGLRVDETSKKEGFLGEIPMNDGRVMTEHSVGVGIDGKETLIPSIVPTLTKDEIDFMAAGGDPRTNDDIMNKAVQHAIDRMQRGRSPFYGDKY